MLFFIHLKFLFILATWRRFLAEKISTRLGFSSSSATRDPGKAIVSLYLSKQHDKK